MIERLGPDFKESLVVKFDPLLSSLRYLLAARKQDVRRKQNPDLEIRRYKFEEAGKVYDCIEDQWTKPGFDLNSVVNRDGVNFIELGGPSEEDYTVFPYFDQCFKGKARVTNTGFGPPPIELENAETGERKLIGTITENNLIDAMNLPFSEGEVKGGLLSKALPFWVYPKYIPQAHRALARGGLLVLEEVNEDVMKIASESGFEKVRYIRRELPKQIIPEERVSFSAIFQK